MATLLFLARLEQLLNCPDVLKCVMNPLPSKKGVFRTITDGLFYKYHPVVQEHGNNTLIITFYIDDAEVCDALKSKANKHNLRLMYWMLGNIYPELRSKLKAINILAIVKARVAKYVGNDIFLSDFAADMTVLGTDGFVLNIHGVKQRFYAILGFASGDNPGLPNLGGFKETHSAKRPCRMCMALSSQLCDNFREEKSLLRNKVGHELHLNEIKNHELKRKRKVPIFENEDDDSEELLLAKYTDHANPSINYGVNKATVLSTVPGWDVTKCLPQDVMHLMAEGVCDLMCRLLLREACFPVVSGEGNNRRGPNKKKVLKLEDVNKTILNYCDFGHLNVDRPSRIEKSQVTGQKLKQSAAQMLLLIRIIPYILLHYRSPQKLELLRRLIAILNLCMAHELTLTDVQKMDDEVEAFGLLFKHEFPHVKTLKLHCLIHLGTQTLLHGPPRQAACFRYEAMHGEFTSLAPVVRSKKDVALSLGKRLLSKRHAEIIEGNMKGNFLYEGDILTKVESVSIESLPRNCVLPHFPSESSVVKVGMITRHSRKWKEGVVCLLKRAPNAQFGRINNIYMVNEEEILVYQELHTSYVSELVAFYVTGCSPEQMCVKFSELASQFPVARLSLHIPQSSVTKAYLLLQDY